MGWEDKLYSVYRHDRYLLVYYLSVPFLFALYFLVNYKEVKSFGYLWVPENKRVIMQHCGKFNEGFCSISKDVCGIAYKGKESC
jgi:hypothetical protein